MSRQKPTTSSSVPPRVPFTDAEGAQQFRASFKEIRAAPGVPIDEFPSDPTVSFGDRWESAILKGEKHKAAQEVATVLGKAFGPDAEQGRKVRAGREEARKKRAVNLEKVRKLKIQEYQEYQTTVDALHKKHPDMSYNSICEHAGSVHERSYKTIKRHTKNPLKHSPR